MFGSGQASTSRHVWTTCIVACMRLACVGLPYVNVQGIRGSHDPTTSFLRTPSANTLSASRSHDCNPMILCFTQTTGVGWCGSHPRLLLPDFTNAGVRELHKIHAGGGLLRASSSVHLRHKLLLFSRCLHALSSSRAQGALLSFDM
jgi:hypothetical protein